jgi:nitronate monooxygenase
VKYMKKMKPNILNILRISNAFIQAPMLGVTSPSMVAAVANAGCLGSLPVGGLSVDQTRQLIRDTKKMTNGAINVNTFSYDFPVVDQSMRDSAFQMTSGLNDLLLAKGFWDTQSTSASPIDAEERLQVVKKSTSYRDQLEVFIEERVPIVSFTFGCMTPNEIDLLHRHRVVVLGTATSVAEALFLKAQGVDVIVAQGYEAGGHKGSFMPLRGASATSAPGAKRVDLESPGVGLFSLLPQLCGAVNPRGAPAKEYTPIVAAGGVYSGRTAVAALTLGADAVQMGSCFINTVESLASVAHKRAVATAADVDTEYTNVFSGRSARGIRNAFTVSMAGTPLPYPVQNVLTAPMRQQAAASGDAGVGFMSIWAGQSSGRYGSSAAAGVNVRTESDSDSELDDAFANRSCADVLTAIINETNTLLSKQMGLF